MNDHGDALWVWAPQPAQVELLTDGIRQPMQRRGQWWTWPPGLSHGQDYAFVLDGEGPFPDPRSPQQPYGVHGASRWFDTDEYRFDDTHWQGRDVRAAVVYELHVGTFTTEGTLRAAARYLPTLVELGVTMVELMPLAAFEGERGWGYDGVDLYAVHETYGGPRALQEFVDCAHGLGLAVCLDVVYNHLGPSGNYLSRFGPYFTPEHHTPWGEAVNLDGPNSAPVRRFIIDNALRWFTGFHLDGLRLDAVHTLVDTSGQHLLAQLAGETEQLSGRLGRPLSLIAESDRNDPATVAPVAAGGMGMTAQWNDDVHHAIHAYVTGERHGYYVDFGDAATLAKAMTQVFVHDGSYSTFRGRHWGAPVAPEVDGRRFVVATLTHDQVGNRGLGDRPAHSLTQDRLAVAAALLLCSPYTPMLFMGQEWAASTPWHYFTDHRDPDLAEAVRAGRRREFAEHGWQDVYPSGTQPPDPQDRQTMTDSVLRHDEADGGRHRRIREFYRTLLRLREAEEDLSSGDRRLTSAAHASDGTWFILRRGRVRLVLTCAEESHHPVSVPLPGAQQMTQLATWSGNAVRTGDGVQLGGVDVLLLRLPEEGIEC